MPKHHCGSVISCFQLDTKYIAGIHNNESNKQLSDMASVALSFVLRSETFNTTFGLFTVSLKF